MPLSDRAPARCARRAALVGLLTAAGVLLVDLEVEPDATAAVPWSAATVSAGEARGGAGLTLAPAPRPCRPQPAPVAAPAPGPGSSTTIVVVVGAVVVLDVDPAGVPRAARTTTGQAPCRTDVWRLAEGGGPVPAALVARVLGDLQATGQGQDPWPSGALVPLRTP